MRKTLEDLYYGNIRPSEQRMAASSKLRQVVDIITQCETQLSEQLDDAGQAILTKLSDAQQTADNITGLENFILGFRLGVRLMAECMDNNDGNIREVIDRG